MTVPNPAYRTGTTRRGTNLVPRLHGYGGRRLRLLLVLMLRWYGSRISALLYTVCTLFTSGLKRRPTAVMRFTAVTEITIVWATV